MSVTTEINKAKEDLDMILGEVQRLFLLIPESEHISRQSLDIIKFKAQKVRASL